MGVIDPYAWTGTDPDLEDVSAERAELAVLDAVRHAVGQQSPVRTALKYSPDQPRDEHGRFGSGGGAVAAVTAHHAGEERTALGQLRASGGFTFQPVAGTFKGIGDAGYAVSPYQDREHIIEGRPVTAADVHTYMARNADLLSQPDHYLGGWHDPESGKTYLDVSIVVGSKDDAAKISEDYHQEAYFDFHSGESVYTHSRQDTASKFLVARRDAGAGRAVRGPAERDRWRAKAADAVAGTLYGAEAEPIVLDLIGDTGSAFGRLCVQLLTGALTEAEFIQQAKAMLSKAGAQAAQMVGLASTDAETIASQLMLAAENDLDDFGTQLHSAGALARAARDAAGKEERGTEVNAEARAGVSEAQATARAQNWAGYFGWGGFGMAGHQQAQDDGMTEADWELEPGADHCDDCLDNADGSPYAVDDLPTLPGIGDTQCRGNCRCTVRYRVS